MPTLVSNVVTGNLKRLQNKEKIDAKQVQNGTFINLKGFAVGNGITNDEDQSNAKWWFANYHGFIDDSLWEKILLNCCNPPYTRYNCMFSDTSDAPNPDACKTYLSNGTAMFNNGKLNPYNIYGTCFTTVEDIIYQNKQNNYLKYFTTIKMQDLMENKQDTIMFDELYQDLWTAPETNPYLTNFKLSYDSLRLISFHKQGSK